MASYNSEDEDMPDAKPKHQTTQDCSDDGSSDDSDDANDSASEVGQRADCDESEETPLNSLADLDEELKKGCKPRIRESEMQLATFRASAQKIADDFLVSQDVKLGRLRKATAAKDRTAYLEGREDSKNIDVRRRRIEEGSSGGQDSSS